MGGRRAHRRARRPARVAGLASLARPRSVPRTRERTAFVTVLGASLICFGLYAAVKAAYLSSVLRHRVEERNLIYVARS